MPLPLQLTPTGDGQLSLALACHDDRRKPMRLGEPSMVIVTRAQLPHTHRLVRGKILCIGG
eukprot:785501-Rhodomonas_salina.1